MGISLFLDFVIFVAISFILKKKNLHVVEYLFIFIITVFLYTSYYSIIVDNLELWKANEEPIPFATYRVAELILFPLLTLWFIDLYYFKRNILYKIFVYILFLISPFLIEKWLIHINVIKYKKWHGYETIIVWFFINLITILIHYVVRKLLIKEGIVHDSSLS